MENSDTLYPFVVDNVNKLGIETYCKENTIQHILI